MKYGFIKVASAIPAVKVGDVIFNTQQIEEQIALAEGKGEGVLRQTLIHELNYRYKSCTYQDASFQEYGYGATQVTIK